MPEHTARAAIPLRATFGRGCTRISASWERTVRGAMDACESVVPLMVLLRFLRNHAPNPASDIAIRVAAPLSIAALCASVRGRMRAK